MKELKELLKRSFELRVKMRWLKTIDKEVKKEENISSNTKGRNMLSTSWLRNTTIYMPISKQAK